MKEKEIKEVIKITKNATGKVALKWNGRIITSNNGRQGMVCGYVDCKNYWIYWFNIRVLSHFSNTPMSKAHTDLKGEKEGNINYHNVADTLHEQFMALAQMAEAQEEVVYEPDYSALDTKQLPGFIHCMEVDPEDNTPVREHYIALGHITCLAPHPDKVEHIYGVQTKDGHMWAYIPDHQFV
jgi:hypothetical protein